MLKIFKVSKDAHGKIQSALSKDSFARNGYIYRQGSTLGLEDDDYYLYVEGPGDFFKKEKEVFKAEGVEELGERDFEKVKEAIEKEQEDVATGLSLFD